MNEVDDFLERHGDVISVIVFTFGGKLPEQRGIVEFIAASERCFRENKRPMNDEEFKAALILIEGDHALDER